MYDYFLPQYSLRLLYTKYARVFENIHVHVHMKVKIYIIHFNNSYHHSLPLLSSYITCDIINLLHYPTFHILFSNIIFSSHFLYFIIH